MKLGGRRLGKGQRVGEYRICRFIASGAVGQVYEAVREPIGRKVALKVMRCPGALETNEFRRFQRESHSLAWLNHPNIVALVEAGRAGDDVFLAMEYVAGGTVRDRVVKKGKLSLGESLRVILGCAAALEHSWEHRIVHRDVKPTNILLTRSGRPKLADLGLARLVDIHPSLTPTGARLGSPSYMAPEQTRDSKSVDIRADVYALGVVWYYCLTGRRPFSARSLPEVVRRIREQPMPDVNRLAHGLPEWVRPCIDRMCAKSPGDRFQDPSHLLRHLAAHGATEAAE